MELLERNLQLAALHTWLGEAEAGQGRLVLLSGEAGVGKTALVRRFCAEVAPRVRVIAGACDPLSTPRPLGPLLDIAANVGGVLEQLSREAIPRHRLFSAFLAELDRGRGPTVALIEDVHWADEATLDLLRFVGRRVDAASCLVVATFRDDEIGPRHPLQITLGDLTTAPAARRLALSPLSLAGVQALAATSAVDAAALYGHTGGNPFFVTEILAAGTRGIPPTVRDAVMARVARLSNDGRSALEAAAVIGSSIELELLSAVIELADSAVDECLASGMLRAAPDALAFRHELARQAVLEAVAPPRRRVLHSRVLEALRTRPTPDAARLAHHAEEAVEREAVLAFAPVAAERAAALHAHREAVAQYARALRFADRLPDDQRGALLERHAHECVLTDQAHEGIASCHAAMEIWRHLGDDVQTGETLRRLSRLYWLAGHRDDAERAGWDAVTVLEAHPPGPQLAMAYSNIAQLFLLAWHAEEAATWGAKAIALAERLGETETLAHALNNTGMARISADDPAGREQVSCSLRLALAADLEEHAARSYGNLGLSFVVDHRFDEADRLLADGIDYCAQRDLDQQRYYMLAWLALSQFHQGHWSAAMAQAAEVLRQQHLSPTSRIMALVALGRVLTRQGDGQAREVLDEALALASQTGELQRMGPVRVARAELAWLAGDSERVVVETKATLDLVLAHQHRWLIGELAFWLWRVGILDAAPPGALELYALQIAGQPARAAACWQALRCPYEAAWALTDAGDEASLRRAHDMFVRLSAAPAAGIVAGRLRELGVGRVPRGPRPTTRSNPANLTAREMEVLALLGDGLSNSEIAERLFCSPRTVAHHVSAILAKLHVEKRRDAVPAAARLAVADQDRHVSAQK